MIPDEVIKAMEDQMTDTDSYRGLDGMRDALAAAEANGWKLVPRTCRSGYSDFDLIWEKLWDAAPSAKEGK